MLLSPMAWVENGHSSCAPFQILRMSCSPWKMLSSTALCAWYVWQPVWLPSHCSCGETFSVSHALGCSKGGLPSTHHNQIKDLTAQFLTEACPSMHGKRANSPSIDRRGILSQNCQYAKWCQARHQDPRLLGSQKSAFFDIWVFNCHAPSKFKMMMVACYRRHELQKWWMYERRMLDVEQGSFTPWWCQWVEAGALWLQLPTRD